MAPRHGYPRGYMRGSGTQGASSSHQSKEEWSVTRGKQEAHNVSLNYRSNTLLHFQRQIDEVEVEVSVEREMTTDSEVEEAIIRWVPDVGTTRARDTRDWKTVDVHACENLLGPNALDIGGCP